MNRNQASAARVESPQNGAVNYESEEEAQEEVLADVSTAQLGGRFDEVSAYMAPMRRYPVLKQSEQYLPLFAAYRSEDETTKKRARDLLVYGNVRLIFWVARRYLGRGLDISDLMQEGMFGLMTAIEKFDPNVESKFSTYAKWWIRQSITRGIEDKGEKKPWRVPVHAQEFMSLVGKVFGELYLKSGRIPTELEIYQSIKGLGTERSKTTTLASVKEALESMATGKALRLDAPMSQGGDSEDTFGTIIPDGPPKTETLIEARRLYMEYKKAADKIEIAVDQLSPRSAMMVKLRFGIGEFEALTLEEVGERYEVTRERVRQIVEKALETLESQLGITSDEMEQIINTTQELEVLAHAL